MGLEKSTELMDDTLAAFRSKLENKSAQVGVIGLGYVGLPLALLFARKGFTTTGFDIDPAKIGKLDRGESYIRHIPGSAIIQQVQKKRFQSTAAFSGVR